MDCSGPLPGARFANQDNPQAHYETTGPEIMRQSAGQITHFVSSMGTTGTSMGVSRYFKEVKPEVRAGQSYKSIENHQNQDIYGYLNMETELKYKKLQFCKLNKGQDLRKSLKQ